MQFTNMITVLYVTKLATSFLAFNPQRTMLIIIVIIQMWRIYVKHDTLYM